MRDPIYHQHPDPVPGWRPPDFPSRGVYAALLLLLLALIACTAGVVVWTFRPDQGPAPYIVPTSTPSPYGFPPPSERQAK